MKLTITIEGVTRAPSWEALEHVVRTALDDEEGLLMNISRVDGGCNYRGLGDYDIDYRPAVGDMVNIMLHVRY